MTDCPFEPDARGWRCPQCGYVFPHKTDRPPRRNCPKAPSRGLGDTIAKVTRLVGIEPCHGCKERQIRLNELFPYRTGSEGR